MDPKIEAKSGINSVTILSPSFPQSTQDVWNMNMWLELPENTDCRLTSPDLMCFPRNYNICHLRPRSSCVYFVSSWGDQTFSWVMVQHAGGRCGRLPGRWLWWVMDSNIGKLGGKGDFFPPRRGSWPQFKYPRIEASAFGWRMAPAMWTQGNEKIAFAKSSP